MANIDGTASGETLTGTADADVIRGFGGNDTLIGAAGADRMEGGADDDIYSVDDAGDVVIENASEGFDAIFADGSYVLAAGVELEWLSTSWTVGTGSINLTGNEFFNYLIGNDGANILNGGAGADLLIGWGGDDRYIVDDLGDQVSEGAGQGNDRVSASISYALAAGQEIETLATVDNQATTVINLTGNEIANILFGNNGANILNGAAGADTMTGFGGNDIYYVDDAGDIVQESAGSFTGNDAILTDVSYVLGAGVILEWLSTSWTAGTGAINLTGNAIGQVLLGNYGVNSLDGGAGNDLMLGFGGDDIYYVDSFSDRTIEAPGEGTDWVYTTANYTLIDPAITSSEVENLSARDIHSTNGMQLSGNLLANIIIGNDGANNINGHQGLDTLTGGGGADNFQIYNIPDSSTNWDTITDFAVGTDKIMVEDTALIGIGGPAGPLSADKFVTGTAAADTSDRIIYNSATGELFFDADGSGAGAMVHFATVTPLLPLSASDFIVN